MSDPAFMRRAFALAAANAASGRGGPFGAVVVLDGRIVGEGVNQVTTSLDPTAHAEIVAIRAACAALGRFALPGAAIYSSCEPCPMCLTAIWWARLDRIWFGASQAQAAAAGFDDAAFYRELARDPAARAVPASPLLSHEAEACFEVWRANPGRVPY